MKDILREVKYTHNLEDFGSRVKYLSRVVSHMNNTLLDNDMSPSDKARLYSSLVSAVKAINDTCRDKALEEIDKRLTALEAAKK